MNVKISARKEMAYLITLRFTQALLKDMKITSVEHEDIPSLFSWHVNIYRLNNRKHILFVNDLSRICVIVNGIRTSQLALLKEKFIHTLTEYLTSEGLKQTVITSYVRDGTDIIISKTNNKSVLGTMKEITIFNSDRFEDNIERLKWLNRIIYKPIDYHEPIEVFKEAIQSHYLEV